MFTAKQTNALIEEIEALSPALRVKISPRAKRLALRLDSKERVMNVVVPKRASLRKAHEFVLSHETWIRERLSALPEQIKFEHGTVFPLFGEDVCVDIHYDLSLKTTNIILKNNVIFVSTNKNNPSARIERYLRKQARTALLDLAHEKASSIGKQLKSVTVRDTKSRWGSCSPDGALSFSWRLIFAPFESLDYVVAHEVAHLVHMDHSKKFWALCAELSQDYSSGKKWIRTHGHSLMRYG